VLVCSFPDLQTRLWQVYEQQEQSKNLLSVKKQIRYGIYSFITSIILIGKTKHRKQETTATYFYFVTIIIMINEKQQHAVIMSRVVVQIIFCRVADDGLLLRRLSIGFEKIK
jgi:hypothetical protein